MTLNATKNVSSVKNLPSSSSHDAVYMLGLRAGDIYALRYGQNIKVGVSTTHPAMLNLFKHKDTKYWRDAKNDVIRLRRQVEREVRICKARAKNEWEKKHPTN